MADILILTASFGMGHKSVSNALKEQIEAEYKHVKVSIEDVLEIVNPKVKKFSSKIYSELTESYPSIYNKLYDVKAKNKNNIIDNVLSSLYYKRFYEYMEIEKPKVIISTFPLCSCIVAKVKEEYNDDVNLITVITDVVDSWEWIYEGTNKYLVPTDEIKDRLIAKGVNEENILVTGIPVKKEFLDKKICFSTDKKNTILVVLSGIDSQEVKDNAKPTISKEQQPIVNSNSEVDALKDVEATAKALDGVDEKILKRIDGELDLPYQEYENDVTPDVSFGARDMQDESTNITPSSIRRDYGGSENSLVYEGYIPESEVPNEILAEEDSDEDTSYDWSELEGRNRGIPPAKIKINKDGRIEILDGNHRIRFWRENGIEYIPAWIIDERPNSKTISEAYHKAKADDSNPELVAAVEELVKPKSSENKPTISKEQQPTDVSKEEGSGVVGDVEATAKKIVGESAFDKLKKEGYTIEKGKFDSDAYASFFGLHTGVQADEFANAGLRLVKPSEKIKVYRGKGKNVSEGENEGVTWVAEDKKVAENYSNDGNVEEIEVTKPKNPFPNPTDTIHVKGSDVGNKLKGILNRLFREGKVTKEQAIEASKAIDEFVLAAGEESELYSTKTNKKGVSSKYVKALQALGFDGIVQKESYNSGSPFTATKTGNETNTYGIFKAVEQSLSKPVSESKSKVADEKNTPITAYHVSNTEGIKEFNTEGEIEVVGGKKVRNYGVYFSPTRGDNKHKGEVEYEAEIDMQNPFITEDQIYSAIITKEKLDDLKSKGYDGVILMRKGKPIEYVVFDNKQIKLTPAKKEEKPFTPKTKITAEQLGVEDKNIDDIDRKIEEGKKRLSEAKARRDEVKKQEMPSLSEIKSDVIEKIPEAVRAVKKTKGTNAEKDKKLKIQKADLVGQLEEAIAVINEPLTGIEHADKLEEQGFEVIRNNVGDVESVVFEIEDDGVFKLDARGLEDAKKQVEKLWPTSTAFKTPSTVRNYQAKQKAGDYSTKAKAEANKQAALDNLELAKSEGDAKRIELFQKQAEIESEAYKEAVEIAESRDMEIKRIEESEIEDIYDIDQKLELPQLKADKAKWEGKEIKEEKPDYEKLKEALDRLEKNEQKEFDEYTEPLRRKDGEIKASINKEQQRRVDNFAFTLNEIKEKRKALEELSPKKKSIDSKIADKKAELKERKENRGKLGILNNQSENEAEILAIYTDLAGLYIAKGLKSALEFAKELGEDLSDLIQAAWDNANKNADDTLPESEGTTPKEEDSPRERKKALSNRAFEGNNTQELKDAIEKHGLTYEVESWEAAKADAKAFIDEVGIEGALEAVRRGLVKGAPAAFIWSETIDTVHNKIAESTSPKEIEQLTKYEAELLEEFNNQSKIAGRFISALQEVYAMSDVNYNVEYQIEKYKNANKGFIAPEVEAKMREMAKQLEDVKERLREAEQREKDITEEINNIKESVERERGGETKSPQEIEQLVAQGVETEIKKIHAKLPTARRQKAEKAAKVLTDFQKRLRSKAYDATIGIPIAIIDGGITVIKNAILAGAKVADAIEIGINNIRGKWGKEWKEDEFRKDIRDAFETEGINVSSKADKPIKQDDGSIKIPHDLIRDLVERGLTDPNELTKAVLDIVRQEIPEATERQVRDAISNYGKVVNLSQEEIEIEIRKIKRAQRIMSALEDIAQKKRPLRSGLQRDVLGTEERALQKQLKEAMKTLPVDLELEAKNLKTSLDAIERRLLNQIADLQREIDLGEKSVKEKKELPYTDRIKELMAERDAMKAMHEEVFGKPEVTDEQRIERAIKATERATAAINKRIADNELETKRRTPVSNAALEVAKAELRAAKERLLGLQELAGIPEKKRLEQAKNAAKRKILELQDRIARKDYSRRKRTPLAEDSELAQLRAEKQTIKDEFDKLQYANELKNRSLTEKIIDGIIEAWGITRALRATAEFSFILIQGGFFVVSHPIIAAKGIATAFSHFASQKRSDDFAKRIKSQTWYNGVKEDKLAITETDYKLNAREELFLNGWVNHIWDILGLPAKLAGEKAYENWKKLNPVKAFERANVGALNTIRLARYFDGVRLLELQGKTRLSHPQDYKNIADLVNTFTGRASIGGVDQSKAMSKVLPMIFFSPKMWASTLKTFTPYSFYHFGKMTSAELGNRGNLGKDNKTGKIQVSAAQKMAMADYMKFVGATGAVVAAFAMKYNNDDDEETSVSFDPNSSDFLKIKIGNTRIDPWGGRIQMIVLQSRLLSNSMTSTSTGKNLPLGVPYKTPTGFGLMGQMTRNKLAPSASLLVKYLDRYENKKGERVDKYGKEVAMSDEVINNLYPIYWETINELHAEQPETVALFLDFYGFLGGGVQTYESKKKK